MKDFNYHRPASLADAVKLIKKAKNGKFLAGGMTLLPTMKQGLAAPSDIVDLAGIKNAGVTANAAKVTVKAGTAHADVAVELGGPEIDPGACRTGPRHRRSARSPPRHHRRLDRQQRSGSRLPGGARGARGDRHHQRPQTAGGEVLHRNVRHRAEARRNGGGGRVSGAEAGRLRQVPESSLALRDGRGVRGPGQGRQGARGGHRRRALRCSGRRKWNRRWRKTSRSMP